MRKACRSLRARVYGVLGYLLSVNSERVACYEGFAFLLHLPEGACCWGNMLKIIRIVLIF